MDRSQKTAIEDLHSSPASMSDIRDGLPPVLHANLPRCHTPHPRPLQAFVEDADEPPAYEEVRRDISGGPHQRHEAITTLLDPTLTRTTPIPANFWVNELNTRAQDDHGIIPDGSSLEPDERPLSRASTVSTEPFPNFDTIELRPPSLVYRCQEEAYEYALTKLAEELVSDRGTPTAATGLTGPNFSTYQERVPDGPSMTTIQGVSPCSELSRHDHFCHVHERQKLRIRQKIYCTLRYSEDIPVHFRRRFTALANMVIDMEFILFRENHFPREPLRFVTLENLEKIRYYGTEMLRYLSRLGRTLNQSKITALSSQCLVSQVAARTELTALVRFQKMTEIVIHFEQQFFALFSKFYDAFLFDDFHVMYNNYLVKKSERERVSPVLVDVSYHLNSVYEILNRLVEDYKILKDTNIDIAERFLEPTLEELTRGPGIWEQCVRASNPDSFPQRGYRASPDVHYTEPRPMQHLLSSRSEPQDQSEYSPFTENRPSLVTAANSPVTRLHSTQTSYTEGHHISVRTVDSPDTQRRMAEISHIQCLRGSRRIVDSPGTQRRMAQLPHAEGSRGPVRIMDSPGTQCRLAQLSCIHDIRTPASIVDSPGTQRRMVQTSYTEGPHNSSRIINPHRSQLSPVQTTYIESHRLPEHTIEALDIQQYFPLIPQEQSHQPRGHAFSFHHSTNASANRSFTEGRQSQSPIVGEIIDFYEHRAPFTEGYRLRSQIVDLDTIHQAHPTRPQVTGTIHHPQPRRRHPFEFLDGHDTQRTLENNQSRHFGLGDFGVQSPPPVYVEQICPSEARYIHSMVQIIRGERPHSPGHWGRARLMSRTPDYLESDGRPFQGPFIGVQYAQPQNYNPGDHVHCHRPHFHVANNGRPHISPQL
ncbi:hypothetical protein BJX64DRAFT_293159 [Aspergillus heterothallicus]